ncbi:hypothetical protein [Haloarcula amylolytica]|uniref:hypothetical protein n=1 Tax=Haloarcula amylolytica TaxID=396317 RepID=UPI003C72C6EA
MGLAYDETTGHEQTKLHTHREHWTTIILEQREGGDWLATQDGVAVEGHGETAADAAADYCQQIAEADDE